MVAEAEHNSVSSYTRSMGKKSDAESLKPLADTTLPNSPSLKLLRSYRRLRNNNRWRHQSTACNFLHYSTMYAAFICLCLTTLSFVTILTVFTLQRNNLAEGEWQKWLDERFARLLQVSPQGEKSDVDQSFPFFRHPAHTQTIDCGRILAGDETYTYQSVANRVVHAETDDRYLAMDCDSVRRRHYFQMKAASEAERRFPIAFSRAVFRDYLLLEGEVAALYAPQNHFCFAIDAKADSVFREQIHAMANCFPNIYVTRQEFKMDSAGHNMSESGLECMKVLSDPRKRWKYLVMLQNHDITLRTNQELVQIFKWLGGANAIQVGPLPANRVNESLDWTLEHLQIFRNKSKLPAKLGNYSSFDLINYPLTQRLDFAKGLDESAISRAAVDYIVNELDLRKFLEQLEADRRYGVDEIFLPTLQITESLKLPGRFTSECTRRGVNVGNLARFSIWQFDHSRIKFCRSGLFRHSLCVFGVEDLVPNFVNNPLLFVNKVIPEMDAGAVECWHEAIFNRSIHDRGLHRLNMSIYQLLPYVRYHKKKRKDGTVDLNSFECTS